MQQIKHDTMPSIWKAAALLVMALAVALGLAACGGSAQQSSSAGATGGALGAADDDDAPEGTGLNVYGEAVSLEPTGTKNILVIGDDSWENGDALGNADMMCLLHVDFDNHEITEVTISRETRWYSEDAGMDVKLNSVLPTYGVERQVIEAGEVIGQPIDFYVHVRFDGLMDIVDTFGGVDMDLPYPVHYYFYTNDYPDEDYEAGEQTIDSWRAMALSRSRTSYTDQSLYYPESIRQYVDRQMLTQLMQQAYNHPDGIPALFALLQSDIDTNIPADTLVEWAQVLGEEGSITVKGTTGPFATAIDDDNGSVYLADPDPEGWAAMIDAMNNRGDLEAAYYSFKTTDHSENIQPVTTTVITVNNQ